MPPDWDSSLPQTILSQLFFAASVILWDIQFRMRDRRFSPGADDSIDLFGRAMFYQNGGGDQPFDSTV